VKWTACAAAFDLVFATARMLLLPQITAPSYMSGTTKLTTVETIRLPQSKRERKYFVVHLNLMFNKTACTCICVLNNFSLNLCRFCQTHYTQKTSAERFKNGDLASNKQYTTCMRWSPPFKMARPSIINNEVSNQNQC
jgi:hypothetical protein